jgi:hypothetical protein
MSKGPIELVAVFHGFRDGALIHPGQSFMFTPTRTNKDGSPKLPKWAAIPGDDRLKPKPSQAADTRPIAAASASAKKRAEVAG